MKVQGALSLSLNMVRIPIPDLQYDLHSVTSCTHDAPTYTPYFLHTHIYIFTEYIR